MPDSNSQSSPQPEIDPRKLFENAPAVLNMLARMTDSLFFYQKAGWIMPPGIRMAAGDAVALIVKLRKDLQPSEEASTVQLKPQSGVTRRDK
jgi:hypothetical protein